MSQNNISLLTNISISDGENDRLLRFWIYLGFDAPSVICSVFVLYHLLSERSARQSLHNHASILMLAFNLIYQVMDIPLHLQYFYTGVIRPALPTVCLVWWFIDWGLYFTNVIILLWAVIERHILIFHAHLTATWRQRLLIHYLPYLVLITLVVMFYILAIFGPFCENSFDFTQDSCGMYPCYQNIAFFATVEEFGYGVIVLLLIAVFSLALLVRVIMQKYHIHRQVRWRRQWKLALNLICIALLYLSLYLPLGIILLVRVYGQPNFADSIEPAYFLVSYFPVFLLPFVCLLSVPNLEQKIKLLNPRRGRRIVATTTC